MATRQAHVAYELEPSGFGEAILRPGLGSNLRPSGPQPQSSSASTSLQYATLGGILPKANLVGPFAPRLDESSSSDRGT